MNQPPSFWRSLFCVHEWQQHPNLRKYDSIEEMKAKLPYSVFLVWECTKCGKIKMYQVI